MNLGKPQEDIRIPGVDWVWEKGQENRGQRSKFFCKFIQMFEFFIVRKDLLLT